MISTRELPLDLSTLIFKNLSLYDDKNGVYLLKCGRLAVVGNRFETAKPANKFN